MKSWRLKYEWPDNNQYSATCCSTAIEHEAIGSSYAGLDSYYNGLMIAHLKPWVIDLEIFMNMKNINEILKKIRKEIPQISLLHFSEIMDIFFEYARKDDKGQAGNVQPDRLNPEDHIADPGKMVCDKDA